MDRLKGSLIFLLFLLILPSSSAGEVPSPFIVTPEVTPLTVEAVSKEVIPLKVKGTQSMTFTTRSLEGTKEGFAPGFTREESLRLNISGKAADTDVDANIIKTSSTGTTMVTEREEKISILLRRGSTEAYFGDFVANIDDVEFASLRKVLSGVRITGDYERWGFKAIASSQKGISRTKKMYGDGTQGPYSVGERVVIDSERVYVDGILQKRGDDYEINYEGGSITFRKKTILAIQIIQIDYEWMETIYQHSTYALRLTSRPNENFRIGTTYINDSDSFFGAEDIREAMGTLEATDPKSHYVFGLDSSFRFGELLSADTELAYSEKNLNILSSEGTKEIGKAFKINTVSKSGPITFGTAFKRIEPKFNVVASGLPKQDLWEGALNLAYRPSDLFFSEGSYSNEKYLQSGIYYSILSLGSKTRFTPKDYPSLNYYYDQIEESNDPVTGSPIDRLTVRNIGESLYSFGVLASSIRGSHERRVNREPTSEATIYRTVGLGLSTIGLEKISASGNVEYKETEEPSGDVPFTNTYIFNLSATPVKEYFASVGLNHIYDSKEGATDVTDLSYKAEPGKEIETDGKYSITSIKEDFAGTSEVVSKQVGSFKIELRPISEVKLRHTYKPNFTQLQRTNALSYNDVINQSEIMYSPLRELSTGLTHKVESRFSIDKTDPEFSRKSDLGGSHLTTLTLKAAPLKFMSIEFNYSIEDLFSERLVSTAEPATFQKTDGFNRRFDAGVRTSLSEKISVDSKYTFEKVDETSDEVTSTLDTLTQTGSIKCLWNLDQFWSLSGGIAYSEKLDYLAVEDSITYTISPGVGFIYKMGEILRIDGDYTYSRSYAGGKSEKSNYSLKTKYNITENIHFLIRGEQEVSREPNYKTTEILGNMEINL